MSNQGPTRVVSKTPSSRFRALLGPLIISCIALIMLAWSWNTWTDPLVDFGTQLYIPWQLTQGKVLYRDIAYYNGPLSQYLNAVAFQIAGVSLRSLILVNLLVLALAIILIYRLGKRASGPIAGTCAAIGFIILFAFNQTVGISNFNWVTPYTNEITHGVVLGFLTLACIARYQRTSQSRWMIAAGVALGLTFLTKAEPFAATAPATIAQLAGYLWMSRAKQKRWLSDFGILFGVALLISLIAVALLSTTMPLKTAALGICGSWRWVFDSRIASLPFYRRVLGTDDVAGNLALMGWWFIGYAIILLPLLFIARKTPRPWSRLIATIVFLLTASILISQSARIDWSSITRPLPVFMLLAMAPAILQIARSGQATDRPPLRLALIIFAAVMLIKVSLNARLAHYGFVLSASATLVMLAVVSSELPDWINHHGGSGSIVRAGALAAALATALVVIRIDDQFFNAKQWWLGEGADRFRVDARGLEVQTMADVIDRSLPKNATLAVFPQGLMLNYLTRRASSTPYLNFMPPEVLAAGEPTILAALMNHPPDGIVMDSSSVRQDQFVLDADYVYGRQTLAWIKKNYFQVIAVELPAPYPTSLHLVLMRPRTIRKIR